MVWGFRVAKGGAGWECPGMLACSIVRAPRLPTSLSRFGAEEEEGGCAYELSASDAGDGDTPCSFLVRGLAEGRAAASLSRAFQLLHACVRGCLGFTSSRGNMQNAVTGPYSSVRFTF